MATGRQYDPDLARPSCHQNHLVPSATDSLEDLLRNDHFTHGRVPEANPLGSVNIDAEDDTGSQPIQEMTSQPLAPIDPSDLPLPLSRPPSNQSPRQEEQILDPAQLVPHALEGTSPPSYGEIIKNAEKVLEHIKNGSVGKDSRHEETSITYYDCFDNIISDPRYISDSENIAALCQPSEDVQQRLIFVEDLSNPTIAKLGETFSINPEFFEEHLLNSGYAGGKYDSPPARNWSTASFDKSHMSFSGFGQFIDFQPTSQVATLKICSRTAQHISQKGSLLGQKSSPTYSG